MPAVMNGGRNRAPWEQWELDLLREQFATGNLNELARKFQRSRKAVMFQAQAKMGLKRDPEMLREQRSAAGVKGRKAIAEKQKKSPRPIEREFGSCYGAGVPDIERAWRGLPV